MATQQNVTPQHGSLPPPHDARHPLIERAVKQWRSQLVDLTGNNRLIYYRELKAGTLNLKDANSDRLHQLVTGGKIRLSDLYPAERIEEGDEVRVDHSAFEDAAKRLRTIDKTGRANFEEKGITTTYLASHLITWDASDTSSAIPNAPVLLAPLEAHALGGSQRDFELRIAGDWEINQTLLIFWAETFGANLDTGSLDAIAEENQSDLDTIAQAVRKAAAATELIPDLGMSSAALVGNFSYTKLPMVKDLEASIDLLARSDLIAAIAGDRDATTKVRDANAADSIPVDIPNRIPVNDEYLVLDADSSQSHVINTVLAGKSTIVEGPPGTGKSQTISNLIASLAAHGNSVLFVAEKRAAIEAVLKRLDDVGLGALTLDLHTSQIRKKDLAQSLKTSLDEVANSTTPNVGAQQARLEALRKKLIEYEQELHRTREPWNLSSFEVNAELMSYDGVDHVDLDPTVVPTLDEATLVQLQGELSAWITNRRNIDWSSPWTDADITGAQHADDLTGIARQLSSSALSRLRGVLERIAQDIDGVEALSVNEIQQLAELMHAAGEVETEVHSGIWQTDLATIAPTLAAKRFLRGGGPAYKDARDTVRKLQRDKLKRAQMVAVTELALDTANDWTALLPSRPRPHPGLADLHAAAEWVAELIGKLGEGLADLADLPFDELEQQALQLSATEQIAIIIGQAVDHRRRLVEAGFEALAQKIEHGEIHEDAAEPVFNHTVAKAIKREIDLRNPILNSFDGSQHTSDSRSYVQADRQHLK